MSMLIRVENDLAVGSPIAENQFLGIFSRTSFPIPLTYETVKEYGYALFRDSKSPTPGRYEVVEPDNPVKVTEGIWERGWLVRPMTADERETKDAEQAQIVRLQRNSKLGMSDWTQFTDSPLDEEAKLAWALYREELRAVTTQPGFPWDVEWPISPAE
jgi:hypothetical protein